MGRFIVMDIVFYGSSLNYDQGTGNYQELKKITKWDGRQYTLVSRYALRYSLLHSSRFNLAPGSVFTQEKKKESGGKATIQPKPDLLFNGEIMAYPEFDLFGFLITNTDPQNFREAPVKISHAVSMTPFNYDTHFCGNHWIAKRALSSGVIDKMNINLFTKEEHETFYQYTVVIDADKVGNLFVYTTKDTDIKKLKNILGNGDKGVISLKINDNDKELNVNVEIKKIENKIWEIHYTLPQEKVKSRIKTLIEAILRLNREIKGIPNSLSPKLMVVGIYKNKPYKTYKDRIILKDEYTEKSYDEIEEREEDGKKIVKVKHVVSKSKKPVFEIILNRKSENNEKTNPEDDNNRKSQNDENKDKELISKDNVWNFIELIFKDESKTEELEQVKVFYDPSVEVTIK